MKSHIQRAICSLLIIATLTCVFGQTEWTSRESGTTANLQSIVWTGDKFVVAGINSADYGGVFSTSPDGISWTCRDSAGRRFLRPITLKRWKNQLFAVGGNDIVMSQNGDEWSVCYTADTSTDTSWIFIEDIACSDSMLVAVGANYKQGALDRGIVLISSDGSTWTRPHYDTIPHPDPMLYSVIWTGEQFVIASQFIYTSPDGRSWTLRSGGGDFYYIKILWTGNLFAATAYGGYSPSGMVWTSLDCISWTQRIAVGDVRLNHLFYVKGILFATGANGVLLVSPDGITWSTLNPDPPHGISSIIYAGNSFIAVGGGGTILTSPDGTTWTSQSSGTGTYLNSVIMVDNLLVAIGDFGTIITSPVDNVPVTHSLPNPGFREVTIKSTRNLLCVELPVSLRGSSVCIYSLAGKKVLTLPAADGSDRIMVNTRVLASGVYQLVIEGRGAKVSKTFVVGR